MNEQEWTPERVAQLLDEMRRKGKYGDVLWTVAADYLEAEGLLTTIEVLTSRAETAEAALAAEKLVCSPLVSEDWKDLRIESALELVQRHECEYGCHHNSSRVASELRVILRITKAERIAHRTETHRADAAQAALATEQARADAAEARCAALEDELLQWKSAVAPDMFKPTKESS